ncbi:hypothetical protein PR202_gb21177 [Eleusine coracana subsp. coracana]|uniref:F-box protein n=1 Tax=Eleusine coracana subsp. coracana TaxID=191504 RepID=A0AAV5FCF6_ELECO|nr:hypothetical protein PR202_gb21177 [Eleusine coracana subsp. coracana]
MASSPVHGHLELEVTALPLEQLACLTDDLLEEIFLRIPCPADLIRTSATCAASSSTTPSSVATAPSTRRSSLDSLTWPTTSSSNSPLCSCLSQTQAAGTSTPPTFVTAASSSNASNFLMRQARWTSLFPIRHPASLSRRYLPPLPWDQGLDDFDAAFAPCDDADETSFRVISAMYYETKLMVRVFDSVSGSWTVATSAAWDALSLSNGTITGRPPLLWSPCYVLGYFYWKVHGKNKLIKLEIDRMEFSTIELPSGHEGHAVVLLETEEGSLGMFTCNIYNNNCEFLNYYNYN